MGPREYLQFALLVVLASAALTGALILLFRRRRSPEERERLRRLEVNRRGRLADGYIVEATNTAIFYSYTVRGVEYAASQDVSTLREMIPGEPERLIGPVSLKYLAANPANSIVISEYWTGLRSASPSQSLPESDRRAG
ncbi:MAG TPA: hypothetical protein VMJ34_03820 [Bryobacteraceae bacterium]|nr:hypothetical protein [Bryobacteraceae bacterium]